MMTAQYNLLIKQHRELANLSRFDISTISKTLSSVATHIKNNPRLCVVTYLTNYGLNIVLQLGNEAIGYIFYNHGIADQNALNAILNSAAKSVSYTYPLMSLVHHLSAMGYDRLSKNDQTVLMQASKHAYSISHDIITSLGYAGFSNAINDSDVNYWINVIGAPIITLLVIGLVLLAERYTGQSVLVPKTLYNAWAERTQCCKKADLILNDAQRIEEDAEMLGADAARLRADAIGAQPKSTTYRTLMMS